MDIPIQQNNDNAEYTICFTTPSTIPSDSQRFFHSENFLTVEMNSASGIYTWSWQQEQVITLIANPASNTKYWIKVIANEQDRVFKYSIDGVNYTQVASYTDTLTEVVTNLPIRIGNISNSNIVNTYFTGTFDLNECYITSNGNYIWKGMDYIERQRIGGSIFNGQYASGSYNSSGSSAYLSTIFDTTWSNNVTRSYNLKTSGLLPNDNYSYEIIIAGWIATGVTSGNWCQAKVSTSVVSSQQVINCATTKNNSKNGVWTSAVTVVGADGVLNFHFSGTSGISPNTAYYLCSYRRLGTNE